jgi:membrane protein implicated in regulation of membrane protease activity
MNQVYRLIAISLGLLAAFLIFLGIVFFIAFAQSPQHPFAPFNTSTRSELMIGGVASTAISMVLIVGLVVFVRRRRRKL